ncbi:MAG TPA: serine/threonine-protein kinase [Kofleriaceae bacterium]|nr:serine/threonine-protein kinase [Kofleriaceae bacterium]
MGDFPIGFGRYQLVERLAMGGMAELFVATSPGEHGFQKKVVIKRLLPHLSADDTYKAMFIDEAKLTARLVHPKIAQTFELGKVDNSLFIAMEFVDGIDVLALLREFASRRKRVDPQLAAWIAHEVLDALDYAHSLIDEQGGTLGIVHRDISPSNVLLSVRGDVKLVDFGIARAIDPERAHKSKTGTLKGKYGYMSPEQVIELPLDGRSDVFSVGVVLAELLTGRRLFAAANELDVLLMVRDAKLGRLDKYGSDIEAGLSTIVRKALKKSVDERWASAAAFRDAIGEWLFEHRHRMTPKHVADVVADLREAVNERRLKSSASDQVQTPVLDEIAKARVPSENLDSVPVISMDIEDVSMPVISVSYDAEQPDPPSRPVTASEIAASTPAPINVVKPKPSIMVPALVPPVKTPPKGTPIAVIPAKLEKKDDAAVEVPIGDTISAAVGAIVLPDGQTATEEDSTPHSFDDLTEQPHSRSRDLQLPSAEELARKKPPTPPSLVDIDEAPDDAGDFAVTSPLRVLFRLMTARATGLLVVAVGGIKKEIYVRDGQPEYVSSNVASELFGNYLVTKGVLSDGELAMALAMMPHYGGKLGDTLVGLGLLKPLEVFRHLTRQVRTKIIDVCTWNKGGFAWYAGRENPREAFPLDFNAFEILGAGAMALAEDVIDSWVAKNGGLKLRASRTRRVGPERFEVKGLVELFESLDGKTSVGDIVERHEEREDQRRVARMLCLLEACDLARP